ncbi:MAG: arginase family protein [Burkholderiales bacterium]|jgi:arginase|nr:arginase family protein [Burkholderiales bacterium]MCE3267784.1 arginase family protein [Burkholderiales bacterium]
MQINLIGAAIDKCAGIAGAADTPQMLNLLLKNSGLQISQIITYSETRNNVPFLKDYFTDLAIAVRDSLVKNEFPLIIGGDHSCAIGTWSGVSGFLSENNQTLGLIWIDAHMDSHTPETSISGNIHGMPLATLFGFGFDEFTSIINSHPKLKPENVVLIGIRSYEDDEAALLNKLGVKIYYNHDVAKLGFSNIFNMVWQDLALKVDKIGLSIDVDGFDPEFTPGVGTIVPDGLNLTQFMDEYTKIDADKLLAVEITEANPILDKEDRTLTCVIDIIKATQRLVSRDY